MLVAGLCVASVQVSVALAASVSMIHSSLNNRDNIPKTAWEVCIYYIKS
jgi:hypothetical protein